MKNRTPAPAVKNRALVRLCFGLVSVFAEDNNFLRCCPGRDTESRGCIVHKELRVFRAAHIGLAICGDHVCSRTDIQLKRIVIRCQAVIEVGQYNLLIPAQ